MIEPTRRGFLGLLGAAAVIAVVPKSAQAILPQDTQPIDPWSIQAPPRITYQWVRCALLGEPDAANVQARLDNGWNFVAPAIHPGAPVSTAEKAIEACGLILMEKPTDQVQAYAEGERFRIAQMQRERFGVRDTQ